MPKNTIRFHKHFSIFCLLMIGVSSLIFGCAHFHPKPISASQTASAFESRKLNDPELKKYLETNLRHEVKPWPPKSWNLNLLTLVAFYYHPDLDVTRAQWGVAKAGILSAGAHLNPTLSWFPAFVSNSDFGSSPWLFGFNLDIPIETAGKRGYRIIKATHFSEASRWNIASVAWQIRSRLKKNLLNLYATKAEEKILQTELGLQEKNLKLLEKQVSEKAFSSLLVTELELQRDQSLISLRSAQKKSAEAIVEVAQSLGVSVKALEEPVLSLEIFDFLPKEHPSLELQRQALINRPDLLSMLAEYAAAESDLQLEIAKQYPDIHLGPGYDFDQGKNKWSLGFSMTLPVFNQNQGPIAEAEARRKEVAVRFRALQAKVIGEMEQALAAYKTSIKKLKAADVLISTQKNKFQFIQEKTQPGELQRVALLQTQINLETSHLIRLNALIEVQQSFGLLEDAIGRPLERGAIIHETPETNPRGKE